MEIPPHTLSLTLSPSHSPPHPATAMARKLAKPPHPSPPDGGEGTKAVITGSVNSSELTLFDPVIHA